MIGALANLKTVTMTAGIALLVGGAVGWHCNTIYRGYKSDKAKSAVIENLGKGQNEIIKFNQKFDKGVASAKDDCVNKPIPDSIGLLLRSDK